MPGPPLGGTNAPLTVGLVRRTCSGSGPVGNLVCKANGRAEGQLTAGLPSRGPASFPAAWKDTLGIALQDGVVGVVGVLHGDGLRELAEHPLLEGLQPLVVVATAHVLLILSQRGEHTLCPACGPASPWASQARPRSPRQARGTAPSPSPGEGGQGGRKDKLHWEVAAGGHREGVQEGWHSEKRPAGPAWGEERGGAIYVGPAPARATTAGRAEGSWREVARRTGG